MVIQLVYLFSKPLYHSYQTFQFINIYPFEKFAFVLKPQVALNESKLDSIDIMCSSIINKYTNHFNQYESSLLLGLSIIMNTKILRIG
jgi:hypothetical protein